MSPQPFGGLALVVFLLLAVLLTVVVGTVGASLFYAVDAYRGDDEASESDERAGIDRSAE